jgi:hypothetical protein
MKSRFRLGRFGMIPRDAPNLLAMHLWKEIRTHYCRVLKLRAFDAIVYNKVFVHNLGNTLAPMGVEGESRF